jgi:predicted amino acid-binding ACT domain protein
MIHFLCCCASQEVKVRERAVCGFTTVDHISLLNIEGTGMIGVPGIAHRLFGALSTYNISVMFIAQASSEHSICFATHTIYADRACEAIQHAFFYELKQKYISAIRVVNSCSIIAAVGESMCHMPGVAGLFFGALGDASINVLSISQGCDERNLSAVVYTKDATRALRAVHSAFWLSSLELSIGIVGTGRVGSALLQTLLANLTMLESRLGLRVKIRGVANSRKMLLGEDLTGSLREILTYFGPSNASTGGIAAPAPPAAPAGSSVHAHALAGHAGTPTAARKPRAESLSDMAGGNAGGLSSSAWGSRSSGGIASRSNSVDVRRSESSRSLQDLETAMSNAGDDKADTDLDVFLQHVKAGPTPHTGKSLSRC